MLFHPRRVNCVWIEQQTITPSAFTNTHWTSVNGLHLTRLAAVEGSSKVGVYHSFPAFRGYVLCRAAELTSTIVHQEVYPAVLLQHRRYKGIYLPHGESKQDTTVNSGDHVLTKCSHFGGVGPPHSRFGCYIVEEWHTQGWREGSFVSSPELLPPASQHFYWRSPHCSLRTNK